MTKQSQKGQLYYVMGASGAGKDSLLNYVRPRLSQTPVLFAHRYITRPVELSGENHISLTKLEFVNRQQHGCFLFHWQSHGLHYGIGQEVQDWLEAGLNVVVNGSRGYLPEALAIMPDLVPILIVVSLDKLQQRLELRGRESAEQIVERLECASNFNQLTHAKLIKVNNDGALAVAGESVLRILQK